ncbi:MAG: hypothetical protein HY291_08335 [Planctomycetes bacterium]|nr:hypothetical protein [Planctomycetota bacterium]
MERCPQGLVLGTACVPINPRPGVPLVGYSDRINTGVALDLCLRVAVFGHVEEQTPACALLVLDTLSTGAQVVAEIRARAAEAVRGLAPTAVMVAATHTHSGPTLDPFRKGKMDARPDAAYLETVLASIGPAVRQAWNARESVLMRVGLTEARLGHNRRVVDAAGKAVNEWLDPDGRHHGYFDARVRFLAFHEAATGRLRSILNGYGCHPVTLGPKSLQVSADYPGYLVRALEARTGASVCIHATGAAANINPREALFAEAERARPMGEALAQAILDALPAAHAVDAAPIAAHVETLALTLGPEARANYTARADQSTDGRTLMTEIQALRLGQVALVSAPGELFAEIGTAIENSSPFPHTFVVGYSNDSLGYLCTEAAIREGGYEASTPISRDVERPILETARKALQAVLQCEHVYNR